jgi:uncharacterized protein YjaZ
MRRLLVPFFFTASFLILVSCSNDSSQDKSDNDKIPSQTSITFSHNKQAFQIIPLYEEVLDYTNLVKENPSLNNKEEYFDKVVEPFQKIASEKNVDIKSNYFSIFEPTTDVQKLEENTNNLLRHQDQINGFIKKSLISSAKLLSGDNKTIFIMPFNPENSLTIQEMGGIAGWTLSKNVVILQIDPSFTEMALKYTVAHEYHHTIAMESNGDNAYPLLNPIIFEGKADSFATLVYPDTNVPWIEPLTDESEKIVLNEIRENIDSFDSSIFEDLLNGDPAKGIPPWSSYKMGYQITQSFLKKNPDVPIDEWTKLAANEILQGSDYKTLLK